jgi:superfamily I DNA/RNA helicase
MTFDFFEGAAGTGKTHNLVGRAGERVQGDALGDDHKLLALTFMNGARRRLDARLGENPAFRRRFDCQTFDVFARMLAARRRSLISLGQQELAATLNAFDGPCSLAASLLEQEPVRQWVARAFPLVVVDEAQDLDDHRMRILQGLSQSCRIATYHGYPTMLYGQHPHHGFGHMGIGADGSIVHHGMGDHSISAAHFGGGGFSHGIGGFHGMGMGIAGGHSRGARSAQTAAVGIGMRRRLSQVCATLCWREMDSNSR